jgi:hypothetical protein
MVAAAGVRATQASTLAAVTRITSSLRGSQAYVLTAINFPSKDTRVSQVRILGAVKSATALRTTQAFVLAAVLGRVANPRVRAWTFTLDGHDFYVLRLGDTETLVYDLYSQQWVNWDSLGLPFWRLQTGINWIGGQALGHTYGSSIVAGDDSQGVLWFLDPNQPFDQHTDPTNPTQQVEFERVVMGQVVGRGRGVQPCYVVFVTGDNYGITGVDFTPFVKLEYSDDAGKNYINAGSLGPVDLDSIDPPYGWYSLGQIDNPGRLFKITDNGVFSRIDDMQMNDDAG